MSNNNIKTKTISATEAKLHLGHYLDLVGYGKETIIIEKMGKEIAHIVPSDLNPDKKEKKTKQQIWEQARGMWKDKKPDPIKELKKIRKHTSGREKDLDKLMKDFTNKKK